MNVERETFVGNGRFTNLSALRSIDDSFELDVEEEGGPKEGKEGKRKKHLWRCEVTSLDRRISSNRR